MHLKKNEMKSSLLAIFDEIPCTIIVQGSLSIFEATLKFIKNPILIGISSKFNNYENEKFLLSILMKYNG